MLSRYILNCSPSTYSRPEFSFSRCWSKSPLDPLEATKNSRQVLSALKPKADSLDRSVSVETPKLTSQIGLSLRKPKS